jgi:hypothetical protein
MDTDHRERLVERYFEALDTDEYGLLRDAFSADVRYFFPGVGKLETVDETVRFLAEEKPTTDTDHRIDRVVHVDDLTMCEGQVTAEHREHGRVRTNFLDLFEFDEGSEEISVVNVYTRDEN